MMRRKKRLPREPFVRKPFLDDVRAIFGTMLDRHGFHVVEAKDFDSFDNALVIAQSDEIVVPHREAI
jgi:hypothetical protein